MDGTYLPINVARLAKEKKMRLGDVEKEIGVSIGYFSRFNTHKNRHASVQTVIKAAEVLDVTIEELLSEPPIMKENKAKDTTCIEYQISKKEKVIKKARHHKKK